ncbi:DoxX family protein [Rhodococcus opacus]|uniref:DoxX family protein n=1 Tax=Rhodococcus TaxID=1827 RepID=UPI001F0F098D|nr:MULTISPECIES: DoxX family protein [Rhodococcus]MDI9940122.1 DoxX family protein [Rhodococcus sp. IEGM 1351]MDV6242092.1 DoxX family protein [Rhodococcus opacus]UNM99070.1 DoxX family protein [Rhodococcus opacus]
MDAVDTALMILRVTLGVVIAAHGYAKFFRGGRIPGTAGWFESIGMKPGRFHALLAASTEVAAGILLVLGMLTPLAAALVIALMLVAAWTVHRGNGFFIAGNGWEYNLVLGLSAFVLAVAGPGTVSIDHVLFGEHPPIGVLGGTVAAVVGLAGGIGTLALFFRPATVVLSPGPERAAGSKQP